MENTAAVIAVTASDNSPTTTCNAIFKKRSRYTLRRSSTFQNDTNVGSNLVSSRRLSKSLLACNEPFFSGYKLKNCDDSQLFAKQGNVKNLCHKFEAISPDSESEIHAPPATHSTSNHRFRLIRSRFSKLARRGSMQETRRPKILHFLRRNEDVHKSLTNLSSMKSENTLPPLVHERNYKSNRFAFSMYNSHAFNQILISEELFLLCLIQYPN